MSVTPIAYFADRLGVTPFALYSLAPGLDAPAPYAIGDDLTGALARDRIGLTTGQLAKIGDPVVGENGATVGRSNSYETPFTADTLAAGGGYTLVAVVRKEVTAHFPVIGNYDRRGPSASLNMPAGPFPPRAVIGSLDSAPIVASGAAVPTGWSIQAASVSPTELQVMARVAGEISNGAKSTFSARSIGGGAFRIGSAEAGIVGQVEVGGDIAAAAFIAAPLTEGEFTTLAAGMAEWLGPLGLGL